LRKRDDVPSTVAAAGRQVLDFSVEGAENFLLVLIGQAEIFAQALRKLVHIPMLVQHFLLVQKRIHIFISGYTFVRAANADFRHCSSSFTMLDRGTLLKL